MVRKLCRCQVMVVRPESNLDHKASRGRHLAAPERGQLRPVRVIAGVMTGCARDTASMNRWPDPRNIVPIPSRANVMGVKFLTEPVSGESRQVPLQWIVACIAVILESIVFGSMIPTGTPRRISPIGQAGAMNRARRVGTDRTSFLKGDPLVICGRVYPLMPIRRIRHSALLPTPVGGIMGDSRWRVVQKPTDPMGEDTPRLLFRR